MTTRVELRSTASTFVEAAFGGEGNAPTGYKRAPGANLHVVIEKHSRVLGAIVLPANLQDQVASRCQKLVLQHLGLCR